MSEAGEGDLTSGAAAARAAGGGDSAGSLLRQARQAQGLHVAALATMIKVTPRKLEALEADRYDELPDATFTRALAQAVCRALKIDAGPVLARLPAGGSASLARVEGSLNAPLRGSRAVRRESSSSEGVSFSRPVLWAGGLLAAAALVYLLPANLLPTHWLERQAGASAPRPGEVASAPGAAASVVLPTPVAPVASAFGPAVDVASSPSVQGAAAGVSPTNAPATATVPPSTPATATTPATAPTAAAAPAGNQTAAPVAAASGPVATAPQAAATGAALLRIATTGASWIEVQDGAGKVLLSRTVQAGESLALDGPAPLRLKVGNAAVTQVTFRGQPVPMTSKDNVVRVELK